MGADALSAEKSGRPADGEPARSARNVVTAGLAAVWTVFAFVLARVRARRQGVAARAPRGPRFPVNARFAIWWVLEKLPATCLERALVLQQWSAGQGLEKDVIVGVPVEGVGEREIHAWVDGDPHVDATTYAIIHRLPLRATAQS